MVDVVWPGVIKDHLLDLKPYSKGIEKEHFPAIVANNTVDGKLVAMPWFTDAGLLFYRKDLIEKYGLKAPATWEDMATSAKKIQDGERAAGNADFQGFVFQAKAYEGLTCDLMVTFGWDWAQLLNMPTTESTVGIRFAFLPSLSSFSCDLANPSQPLKLWCSDGFFI